MFNVYIDMLTNKILQNVCNQITSNGWSEHIDLSTCSRLVDGIKKKILSMVIRTLILEMHCMSSMGLLVGETEEENISNNTLKVCIKEIDNAFIDNEVKNIIISYEPIWSIGTGLVPKNDFIEDIVSNIKKYVYNKYGIEVLVLYGGSVSEENIEKLEKIPSLDGYLIGGCALDPESMEKLINCVRG